MGHWLCMQRMRRAGNSLIERRLREPLDVSIGERMFVILGIVGKISMLEV